MCKVNPYMAILEEEMVINMFFPQAYYLISCIYYHLGQVVSQTSPLYSSDYKKSVDYVSVFTVIYISIVLIELSTIHNVFDFEIYCPQQYVRM